MNYIQQKEDVFLSPSLFNISHYQLWLVSAYEFCTEMMSLTSTLSLSSRVMTMIEKNGLVSSMVKGKKIVITVLYSISTMYVMLDQD